MLDAKYINESSIKKAADEVMRNIKLLIIGGYHNEAFGLSETLLNAGPWQINSNTAQINELQGLHQILCWLCHRACPAIADESARDIKKLEGQAEENWNTAMDSLLMSDRLQIEPAGSCWNESFFRKLDQMDRRDGKFNEYGLFINDVDWVLKHRLRGKTARTAVNLLPDWISECLPGYSTDNEILLSPVTDSYDTHWLTDKLAMCSAMERQISGSQGIGYMEVRILLMQLIIDVMDDNEASEQKQIERLLNDEDMHDLLELIYWPQFSDRIKSGRYRKVTGITDHHVADYLQAFADRKSAIKDAVIQVRKSSSEVDLTQFRAIAKNTPLEKSEFIELPVPLSDQTVLATRVKHKSALPLWKEARALLDETGRWPVLVIGWGGVDSDWKTSLKDEHLLDRECFQSEHYDGDRIGLSAQDLISGAGNVDLEKVYHEIAASNYEDIAEFLSDQLDDEHGLISSISSNIDHSAVGAFADASKRLGKRIIEMQGLPEPFPISWFDPTINDPVFLFLMPTENSWEIPAYLQWYGAESCGTEITVAQLKEWNEKYGAELVCHYCTMLQLTVNNKPDSIDDALDLAYAQDSLAACTLSGCTIAEYAVSLMHSDSWFLHERP